ncbi:PilZ domain-containing protein [Thiomicrorhabdus sp. Kp2]|uniref:PilZ domain-containing protein n=1 Tax=Thiomicrorhabdus sp. Kp2 TaxID=1123518 RepID=UPI0003F66F6C|nr:PilZ domain-containing protein [Thiomicrorhabdus sp. Kp2]
MKTSNYKTNRKALLIGKNGSVEAILTELSLKGAGVRASRGAKEGTELELEFEIPSLGEFTTLCVKTTVTHRHNSEDEIYLKLLFEELSHFEQAAIKDFLEYKERLIQMGKHRAPMQSG